MMGQSKISRQSDVFAIHPALPAASWWQKIVVYYLFSSQKNLVLLMLHCSDELL